MMNSAATNFMFRNQFHVGAIWWVACWLCLTPTRGFAQVMFTWPESKPKLETYRAPQLCLGRRVAHAYLPRTLDTTRRFESNPKPVPPELVRQMRECAQKFSVSALATRDSFHIESVRQSYRLLLAANRDADARALAQQWVQSLSPDDDSLRNAGIARLADEARRADSVRWDEAWFLVELIDPVKSPGRRVLGGANIMYWAYYARLDTTQVRRAALWLIKAQQALDASVISSADWGSIAKGAFFARRYLQEQEVLDSLRVSTDSYLRYINILRQSSRLENEQTIHSVPPVQGEYWFPDTSSMLRPAPGRVSVIIKTNDNTCANCTPWIHYLKSLHETWPEVEFTLITKTVGFYGLVIEPPPPDREAWLIDSVYRTVHRAPVTLAVHRTEFFRIADPDRRRINVPGPNDEAYGSKGCQLNSLPCAYIVDRNGLLIDVLDLGVFHAVKIRRLLQALVEQGKGVQN